MSNYIDHASQAAAHHQPFPDRLHVGTVVTNPGRFRTRYELYRGFEKHVTDSGAVLHTAEIAFGGRPFEVTESSNPYHLQLRTNQELWHKERGLNVLLASQRARFGNINYWAWVDADVQFTRKDWAQETLQQLQHFKVVQMFSQCQDVSPDYEVVADPYSEQLPGMVHQHVQAIRFGKHFSDSLNAAQSPDYPVYTGTPKARFGAAKAARAVHPGHCGYAWAARVETLDQLGGLLDFSPCGANDHHMARALLGDISQSVHGGSSQAFKDALSRWGNRVDEFKLKPYVGYVPGIVTHYYHGPKRNRRYNDRWQILTGTQFDPSLDLRFDTQGLYQLTDRSPRLRMELMAYFRQRNEDDIRVD